MKISPRCAADTIQMLALSTALLDVAPASAALSDLYDRYFSNVLDGRPCFARTYDEARFKKYPGQRVQSIAIELAKANADGTPNSADRFELKFSLLILTNPEWYAQTASCKTNDTVFECYLEADGGLFRLTPNAAGGLRLETGETGLALEGTADTIELSGKTGDDRVFDLIPSKDECEAARVFFEDGAE
jgi:hypothetical protein